MKAKNPTGRVDVLLSRVLEELVKRAKGPTIPLLYAGAKPGLELLIRSQLGPRTKRGRVISRQLLDLRDAYERVQAKQREIGQGARV